MLEKLHRIVHLFKVVDGHLLKWVMLVSSLIGAIDALVIFSVFPFLKVAIDGELGQNDGIKLVIEIIQSYFNQNEILVLGILALTAVCMSFFTKTFGILSLIKYSQKIRKDLGNKLFSRHILDEMISDEAISPDDGTVQLDNLHHFILWPFIQLILASSTFLVIITLLLIYDPISTSIALLICFCFFTIVVLSLRNKSKIWSRSYKSQLSARNDEVHKFSRSLAFNIQIGQDTAFQRNFNKITQKITHVHSISMLIPRLPKAVLETFALSIVIVLILFQYNGNENGTHIGELSIFIISAYKMIPAVNNIFSCLQQIQLGAALLDHYHYITTLKKKNGYDHCDTLKKNISIFWSAKNIKIDGVTVSKITLQHGKFYGVCGPSGVGKSTFFKNLAGLEKSIELIVKNGERELSLACRRKHFMMLQSDTNPYSVIDSVDNTLKSVSPNFSNLGYFGISKRLTEIENNPENDELSTGERHRLLLMEGLRKNYPILLIDEILANLDERNKELISKHLKDHCHKQIILVISHDPLVLSKCDSIIEFEA